MAEDEEVVFTTSTGPVRVITAASLFDGHDAAINVMRRLIQSSGAEVIHLGHDQSAKAVVDCAIQEDAHAVALTSYQGGHVEYFTYIRQLLDEAGCEHVRHGSSFCCGSRLLHTPSHGRSRDLRLRVE